MPQLRAPSPGAERREGGRHGRPQGRLALPLPEAHIRTQMLRLAVLPSLAMALCSCAVVLFTVRTTGRRPDPALWVVLAGAAALVLAGLVISAVAADRVAKTFRDRIVALRRTAVRRADDLTGVAEALARGEEPPAVRGRHGRGAPVDEPDDLDLLADALRRAHDTALAAVRRAGTPAEPVGPGPGAPLPPAQAMEVFNHLAHRLQALVHREILLLDEIEDAIEDPDLLKSLFHIDHLATRTRRHAENLAVLGGAVSRRQWSRPVPVTEVLRSATAEVEQYSRVRLVPPTNGTLHGHAVADVVHLLAELIENATVFSAPHTHVLLKVDPVTSGLAIEVEDRGLGMPAGEQERMNALLADPCRTSVGGLLKDGRIGLFVVSQLARRHGISVRLGGNIYGGVQAVLVLPRELLGSDGSAEHAAHREAVGARERGALPGGAPALPALAPGAPRADRSPAPPADHPRPGRPAPDRPAPEAPVPDHPLPVPAPPPGVLAPDGAPPAADTPAADTLVGDGPPDRPALPRRHAQQHLAPQLRNGAWGGAEDGAGGAGGDGDGHVGHDPGLMAAFQRGVTLAELAAPHPEEPAEDDPPPDHDRGADHDPRSAPRPDHGPDRTDPQTAPHDTPEDAAHDAR
ncbi:ATP-binding protein [Streptomyces sp. NPDC050560]|uniref:ATP-binding protein n=1 Tax=Streptomyces sp. NPDC050560 TaxID=3365630 RepID=UPI0037AA0208